MLIETADASPGTTLWSPTAVATDGDRVYVADAWNRKVWRLAPDGRLVPVPVTGRPGQDHAPGGPPAVRSPGGVTLAADGGLYVADTGAHLVWRLEADGITTVARLRCPGALATAPDGAVLIATRDGIHRLETDGRCEPVPVPPLVRPAGIAISPAGIVYIADAGSDRVLRVSPAGVTSTVAGAFEPFVSAFDPTDGDGGPAFHARLRRPTAIATDGVGGLVVFERDAGRLRRILPDGSITTLARLAGQAALASHADRILVVTNENASWLRPDGAVRDRRRITRTAA